MSVIESLKINCIRNLKVYLTWYNTLKVNKKYSIFILNYFVKNIQNKHIQWIELVNMKLNELIILKNQSH